MNPFAPFDAESYALQLQIDEIEAQRANQKGKWTADRIPDYVFAFDAFEVELRRATSITRDHKLAHSIARAVDADAAAIEELVRQERQAGHDHDIALQLNRNDAPPARETEAVSEDTSRPASDPVDWSLVWKASGAATLSTQTPSTTAGPSADYALRQEAVHDHLRELKVECSVCSDMVQPHAGVRLECDDLYCRPCLKAFLMRVAADETLYPPKCHRKPIDAYVIEAELSSEELAAYRTAEMEFTSTDRLYCADPTCARFIPMAERGRDRASCHVCRTETCTHCKEAAHHGACAADEERNSLKKFAAQVGWQSCFGCGEMVSRDEGCDHMTCRCRAEFCYQCGTQWKRCSCSDWAPDMLDQRARQVVDREAQEPMVPAMRRQRVERMARELQANHECEHLGRFMRLDYRRRGYGCEMCGARHYKYILSCRHCHMLACEDCRRYRI
ncbi:IBR protein [Geosmithia morbida]|uniref:RBR-type E3 ubiquitin transferase n=1 Tax=Geosmithia morbida TaxID=1094350 RepID=A0A9P5D942_9HYPO|nr:IBR protein [Geosmithia morbida]KAF4126124.1 IBR protein [Geosmithia morbida]